MDFTNGQFDFASLADSSENWNPELAYPLYVKLHGLTDVYGSRIQYLTRYLGPQLFFEGTLKTVIHSCPGGVAIYGIKELQKLTSGRVSRLRIMRPRERREKVPVRYVHGGYGTWSIGAKSPENWAAIGIYAAALCMEVLIS